MYEAYVPYCSGWAWRSHRRPLGSRRITRSRCSKWRRTSIIWAWSLTEVAEPARAFHREHKPVPASFPQTVGTWDVEAVNQYHDPAGLDSRELQARRDNQAGRPSDEGRIEDISLFYAISPDGAAVSRHRPPKDDVKKTARSGGESGAPRQGRGARYAEHAYGLLRSLQDSAFTDWFLGSLLPFGRIHGPDAAHCRDGDARRSQRRRRAAAAERGRGVPLAQLLPISNHLGRSSSSHQRPRCSSRRRPIGARSVFYLRKRASACLCGDSDEAPPAQRQACLRACDRAWHGRRILALWTVAIVAGRLMAYLKH